MESTRRRGPRTASLFFPFFCVRSRYWHLASVSEGGRERERDEVRKWIEENVRAENRRQQNLSFSPLPPRRSSSAKLHRRRLGYFSFLRSKRNASLLSLPLSLPSSVRLPIQFPISVSPPSFSAHAINRPTEKLCFREENGVKIGRRRRARPRRKLRGMGWGDGKWEGGDKQ